MISDKSSKEQLRETIIKEQIKKQQMNNQKKKGSKLSSTVKVGGKVLNKLVKT